MKITALLLLLAVPIQEPIRVEVGAKKELTVTIPNMSKQDLVHVTATFFSKGDEVQKEKFEKLINEAPDLTLIITTK